MKETIERRTKYLYLAAFFFLIYLSFLLVKPFILAILASFVVVYLMYPFYKRLNYVIRSDGLCAFVAIIIMFIVIFIPIFFIAQVMIGQATTLYHNVQNFDLSEANAFVNKYLGLNVNLNEYAKESAGKIAIILMRDISEFALSLPKKFVVLFISLFFMYYLLKEGDEINAKLKKYLPLKEEYKDELVERLKDVTYATIYGVIATAIVQGIASSIGFFIFDVSSPLLFGMIATITATLPFGAAIVWLPTALIKLLNGDLFNGIGLLVYGVLVISLVDNFIRPMIISRKSRVHPLVIILGVFGGLSLFGFMGILVGPLILAVLIAFLDFYVKEYEA